MPTKEGGRQWCVVFVLDRGHQKISPLDRESRPNRSIYDEQLYFFLNIVL